MAEYKITLPDSLLHDVANQPDGLANVMQAVVNQILQGQATEQIGAETYEWATGRRNYRNGVRERDLTTRLGTVTLEVPQLRLGGSVQTDLFSRYGRSELAFIGILAEMVINAPGR